MTDELDALSAEAYQAFVEDRGIVPIVRNETDEYVKLDDDRLLNNKPAGFVVPPYRPLDS